LPSPRARPLTPGPWDRSAFPRTVKPAPESLGNCPDSPSLLRGFYSGEAARLGRARLESYPNMEPRLTRLAKNEALFREVNERISEISQELAPGAANPDLIDGLICECSDPQCLERVGPLTIAEYERVRQDPRRFIIAPGHQAADVERVVDRQPTYWTVEKHEGAPAPHAVSSAGLANSRERSARSASRKATKLALPSTRSPSSSRSTTRRL
jgi:hypothetical protein